MLENIRNYFDLNAEPRKFFLLSISDIMSGGKQSAGDPTIEAEYVDLDTPDVDTKISVDHRTHDEYYKGRRGETADKESRKERSGGKYHADRESYERGYSEGQKGERRTISGSRSNLLRRENRKIKVTVKPHSAIGQWISLFAGVLIQPFFQHYQSTHHWDWQGLTGWTLFSLIVSILIFPAVYRRAFDRDKPAIVQLAPIFAAGLGWQSLLSTAITAASHAKAP